MESAVCVGGIMIDSKLLLCKVASCIALRPAHYREHGWRNLFADVYAMQLLLRLFCCCIYTCK